MASKRISAPARRFLDTLTHRRQPNVSRTLTTETTSPPEATLAQAYADAHLQSTPTKPVLHDQPAAVLSPATPSPLSISTQPYHQPPNPFQRSTHVTLHDFPSFEPTTLVAYPSTHLLLPLRKDLLHRAVVYEGDAHRQGSANTKWRDEVHGSGRKVRPQKGTGRARLGDKKSPMLKGGGVAFGPKPRDFSTGLPEKIYDLAWRTALSYRYSRGELIVLQNEPNLPEDIAVGSRERWMTDLLLHNRMGHADGRTLFLTKERVGSLWNSLRGLRTYGLRRKKIRETVGESRHARALTVDEVDVKDLLEGARIVVEHGALDKIFALHQSDLSPSERLAAWKGAQ